MSLELDHVFVFVSRGAPEADRLVEFGLREGEPNVHPGQGTSNRRFFFDNMMLELLFVSNRDEARSELTGPTRLWERWMGRNTTSPFGLIFRSSDGEIPFEGWEYKPEFLPEGFSFLVGENFGIMNEPLVFKMPDTDKPTSGDPPPLQDLPGFKRVTSLCVGMPHISPSSSVIQRIESVEKISFKKSARHFMEIGFDGETHGKSKAFTPDLPLVLKW